MRTSTVVGKAGVFVSVMYTEEKVSKAVFLPIENVRTNPYQPRREIDEEGIRELCESIKQYGLMQPVVVRRINDFDYELIAGERRLRACKLAGLRRISAVVVRAGGTDSAVMALVENIQRENLGYIEEAEAFCTLISDHGLTQEELAEKLGKSQSTIANKIRILKLSAHIRGLLEKHKLTERHARALLRIPDEKTRLKALDIIIDRGLNVTKTEELIEEILKKQRGEVDEKGIEPLKVIRDVRIFSNTIRQAVDLMSRAGIDVQSTKVENEEFIEYTIKIPKSSQKAV